MNNFLKTSVSIACTILFCLANAGWKDIASKYEKISDQNEKLKYVLEIDPNNQLELNNVVGQIYAAQNASAKKNYWAILDKKVEALKSAPDFASNTNSRILITEVKSNEVYASEKKLSGSSWVEKLKNRLRQPEIDTPNVSGPSVELGWLEGVIKVVYWALVAAAIGAAVYVVAKLPIKWNKTARAKKSARGGMLEEGEELKSEDEYAANAERLVAEGKYREACRAYFLASLLRIDALRIARFEPAQTNWEHLRRIESSRRRPAGFEFRDITKRFDYAWYGYEAKTAADVDPFRKAYSEIANLGEMAA